jgi:hypothetical protein
MTPEEAQKAYEEAPSVPITEERIQEIVEFATFAWCLSCMEEDDLCWSRRQVCPKCRECIASHCRCGEDRQ